MTKITSLQHIPLHKVRYPATLVVCGWAGLVRKKSSERLTKRMYDLQIDELTDRQSGVRTVASMRLEMDVRIASDTALCAALLWVAGAKRRMNGERGYVRMTQHLSHIWVNYILGFAFRGIPRKNFQKHVLWGLRGIHYNNTHYTYIVILRR